MILEGVLFGPYTGKFISAAEYEVIKAAKMESGNAWEIREVKKVTKNSGHLPLCQQPRFVSHFDPHCLHIYFYFLWFSLLIRNFVNICRHIGLYLYTTSYQVRVEVKSLKVKELVSLQESRLAVN